MTFDKATHLCHTPDDFASSSCCSRRSTSASTGAHSTPQAGRPACRSSACTNAAATAVVRSRNVSPVSFCLASQSGFVVISTQELPGKTPTAHASEAAAVTKVHISQGLAQFVLCLQMQRS